MRWNIELEFKIPIRLQYLNASREHLLVMHPSTTFTQAHVTTRVSTIVLLDTTNLLIHIHQAILGITYSCLL